MKKNLFRLRKKTLFLAVSICLAATIHAQEEGISPVEQLEQRTQLLENAVTTLQKFKVSGYIQTQYQYAETEADDKNFKLSNRANAIEKENSEDFGRLGVRRGRIKFTYEDGLVQGVFQPDFTEKGLSFKDVYISIKDPWFKSSSLKTGIFDRPFGHEIAYSSSRRESPERARIIQSLFPDERDLGAMLTLQASKTSPWSILKLEAGLFAGNGIRPQISNRMDFIGHLSASKTFGNEMSISGGVSTYLGGVLQSDSSVFTIQDKVFALESKNGANVGSYAVRRYIGFDLQFAAMTAAGLTQIRGEYIFGRHPGNTDGAFDFKLAALPSGGMYMRNIAGGYVILTQDFGTTPFSAVVKYDWYNPNTDVSGNDIKGKNEIALSNIGFGLLWRINSALKMTAYCDIVKNETTTGVKDYDRDRKDNVLTVRLQYKF